MYNTLENTHTLHLDNISGQERQLRYLMGYECPKLQMILDQEEEIDFMKSIK